MSGSIHRDAPCSSEEVEAAQAPTIISLNDRWNSLLTAAQNFNDRAYERLMGEVRHWPSKYSPWKRPPVAAEDATPVALFGIYITNQTFPPNPPLTPLMMQLSMFTTQHTETINSSTENV